MRLSSYLFALACLGFAVQPSSAQVVRQVTDFKASVAGPGALDDAGTAVFTGTSTNQNGDNPRRKFRIVRFDPVTAAATVVLDAGEGVTPSVSVSDDGQWLVFPSPADLTGQNHDGSVEVFVCRNDGTSISQITDDPRVNGGSVGSAVIAGSGNRVLYLSNVSGRSQLYVVDRAGTNRRQLTNLGPTGSLGGIGISDDGTRVVFTSDADLTGANADLGSEIFTINADGTGLRQLTASPAGYGAGSPALSGNGAKIAFQSDADPFGTNVNHNDEIFAVDWAGTGLRQLTRTTALLGTPAAQSPSITDDGVTVVFHSNHFALFPPINIDGNYEIFRIRTDGTGLRTLTSTLLTGCLLPTIAGGGGRVSFYAIATLSGGSNPDDSPELAAMDGNGGTQRQLSNTTLIFTQDPDITPDGSRVVFVVNDRILGNNEIWRVQADGSGATAVTSLSSGNANTPSVSADGQTIAFASDFTGTGNADASTEIFTIAANGSNLVQLTSGASGTSSSRPAIVRGAPFVVFDSNADLAGGNADGSREIFRVGLDGTAVQQLTSGPAGSVSQAPRAAEAGTWIVFESTADMDGGNADGSYEIWRVRSDGTGLARLTGDPVHSSRTPDVSGDGTRITYSSTADLLGTNPELNREIFVDEPAAAVRRQLTAFAEGTSSGPRISADGRWVWFLSDAPVFESDPDRPSDPYRVPAAGGSVERTGAGRSGLAGGIPLDFGGGGALSVSSDGERAAFGALGSPTGANPDLLPEVFLVDRLATPAFRIGKPDPTVLDWTVESGPVRYDIVRGDVAALGPDGSLGPVVCVEDDSPDATTAGFPDPAPPAGKAWFFVRRGSQGLADPGTYGSTSGGATRVPTSGGCP